MNSTKIKTIANAVQTKQPWVRKEFGTLLQIWEEITQKMDEMGPVFIGRRYAIQTKQSWIRKEFETLLQIWEEITQEMGEMEPIFIGRRYAVSESIDHDVFLVVKEPHLYYRAQDLYGSKPLDYYIEGGTVSCNNHDDLTIGLIQWVTPKISPAIVKHFQTVQTNIDNLSKTGQEIIRITNCLKKQKR